VYVTGKASGGIVNCLIADNSAGGNGGGIIAKGWFINCTIAQNEAERYGAFDGYGNTTRWVNCIEWANGTDPFRTGACEIRHCCFSEEIEFDDTHFGNFTADPLFVDADGGDYRLSAASPCIDTGITETTDLFLPEYDLSGETERILNGRIDCGAYEFAGTADVDNRYHRNHPRTSPVWMGGLHRENMDLFDLRGRAVAPVSISRRQAARGWYVLTPANGRSRGSERQIVTGLCR
jgi:hypothetical protein